MDKSSSRASKCPSPVLSSQTASPSSTPSIASSSLSILNELDDSLKKLTIDKKIKLLSSKRNPFKLKKKTSFKEFSTNNLNKASLKGLEEITDKMVELWSTDGYREAGSKDVTHKKSLSPTSSSTSSALASGSTSTSTTGSKTTTSASGASNESNPNEGLTCARQANCDYGDSPSVNELAAYFEEGLFFPKKMSFMAEMMYT